MEVPNYVVTKKEHRAVDSAEAIFVTMVEESIPVLNVVEATFACMVKENRFAWNVEDHLFVGTEEERYGAQIVVDLRYVVIERESRDVLNVLHLGANLATKSFQIDSIKDISRAYTEDVNHAIWKEHLTPSNSPTATTAAARNSEGLLSKRDRT